MKNTDEVLAEEKHIKVPLMLSDHAAPPSQPVTVHDAAISAFDRFQADRAAAEKTQMDAYRQLGARPDPVASAQRVVSDAAQRRTDYAAGRIASDGTVIDHHAHDKAYQAHVQQLSDGFKSPEQRKVDEAFRAAGADRDPDRAAELAARLNSARHRP